MKFSDLFRRNDENEGFDDYEGEEYGYDASSSAVTEEEAEYETPSFFNHKKKQPPISMHVNNQEVKLAIMHPTSYEEVMRDAVSYLKDNNAIVILNLGGISNDQRTRIVDFMTGVVAVLDGKMEKTDLCSYAVAPKNVEWISNLSDFGD